MRDDNRPAIGSTHTRERSKQFGLIASGDVKQPNARLKWRDRHNDGTEHAVTVRRVAVDAAPFPARAYRARRKAGIAA